MAWFHKKFIRTVKPLQLTVLRWFRGSAKSVHADMMFPLFKYFKGELSGMALASDTGAKANKLIGDVQAQFEANELLIHDFGSQQGFGAWSDGYFATVNGTGFWALGVGQSPRGIREGAKRPNYFVCDDCDTKEKSRNPSRVKEMVEWMREDFFRAADITSQPYFIIANNAYSKHTAVKYIVGDVEAGDKKNPDVNCIDAYFIENPRTHERAELEDENSVCSWKERYTKDDARAIIKTSGERGFRRDDQQQHIIEGKVFKNDLMIFRPKLPLNKIYNKVVYLDPSFKNKTSNDYKAICVMGVYEDPTTKKIRRRVLKAWVRQASITAMVKAMYDIYDWLGDDASYYFEANFTQDRHIEDFNKEAELRGYAIPLIADKSKKDDKYTRIENMTSDFERDEMDFCESQRTDPDLKRGIDQLLDFPTGGFDDFPDSMESAKSKITRLTKTANFSPSVGTYSKVHTRAL
jgi:hypothetical protein